MATYRHLTKLSFIHISRLVLTLIVIALLVITVTPLLNTIYTHLSKVLSIQPNLSYRCAESLCAIEDVMT